MDAMDDSLAVAVLKTVIQRCVNVCIEDMVFRIVIAECLLNFWFVYTDWCGNSAVRPRN